jgi:hypothetical protein
MTKAKAKAKSEAKAKAPASGAGKVAKKRGGKAANKIEEATATAVERIGFLAMWDFHDAEIEHNAIVALCSSVGLDEFTPDPRSNEVAFSRALRVVQRQQKVEFKRAKRSRKWITVRPIEISETTDSGANDDAHKPDVEAKSLPAIALDRESGTLTAQDSTSPIAAAVLDEFARAQGKVDHTDLRHMITRVLGSLRAVPLRDAGGVYFVPEGEGHEATLRNLQIVIQGCGESDFYMPVMPKGDADWSRAAGAGAMRAIDGEYKTLIAEAEAFVNKAIDGDLVQNRVLEGRLADAEALQDRAALFGDVLSLQTASVNAASDMLADATRKMITAAVDVRGMRKAKDSPTIQALMNETLEKAATEARELIAAARATYAPRGDDDENADA